MCQISRSVIILVHTVLSRHTDRHTTDRLLYVVHYNVVSKKLKCLHEQHLQSPKCVFCPIPQNFLLVSSYSQHIFFSATMASTYSTYRLGAVCLASLKFLAIENMPRIKVQLRIVDYAMCGGRLSWQSYRIIATRLVLCVNQLPKYCTAFVRKIASSAVIPDQTNSIGLPRQTRFALI